MAAVGDNNVGMAGVMWQANVTLKPTGPVNIATVIDSIAPLLQNNVVTINLSLGNGTLQSISRFPTRPGGVALRQKWTALPAI